MLLNITTISVKDNNALDAIDYATRLYPTATTPLAFKARLALFIDEEPRAANEDCRDDC